MARVAIPLVVLNNAGVPIEGASVVVRKRADNSNASVWSAETGGTNQGATLATNAQGRVTGWLDRGAYKLSVSASGLTAFDEMMDAAPAGDQTVDTSWLSGTAIPIGVCLPYAGTGDPSAEWLICDGRAVSRSTYSTLFARIGGTYGNGDGSTTFNIPNTAGRGIIGSGTGSGLTARTRGATGGEESHVLTSAEGPDHTHGFNTFSSNNTFGNGFANTSSGGGFANLGSGGVNGTTGQAHNNMQPWLAMPSVIRAL